MSDNTELAIDKLREEAFSYLNGVCIVDKENKTITISEGGDIEDLQMYLEDDWGEEGKYLYNDWFENECESGEWTIGFANSENKLTYKEGSLIG